MGKCDGETGCEEKCGLNCSEFSKKVITFLKEYDTNGDRTIN